MKYVVKATRVHDAMGPAGSAQFSTIRLPEREHTYNRVSRSDFRINLPTSRGHEVVTDPETSFEQPPWRLSSFQGTQAIHTRT